MATRRPYEDEEPPAGWDNWAIISDAEYRRLHIGRQTRILALHCQAGQNRAIEEQRGLDLRNHTDVWGGPRPGDDPVNEELTYLSQNPIPTNHPFDACIARYLIETYGPYRWSNPADLCAEISRRIRVHARLERRRDILREWRHEIRRIERDDIPYLLRLVLQQEEDFIEDEDVSDQWGVFYYRMKIVARAITNSESRYYTMLSWLAEWQNESHPHCTKVKATATNYKTLARWHRKIEQYRFARERFRANLDDSSSEAVLTDDRQWSARVGLTPAFGDEKCLVENGFADFRTDMSSVHESFPRNNDANRNVNLFAFILFSYLVRKAKYEVWVRNVERQHQNRNFIAHPEIMPNLLGQWVTAAQTYASRFVAPADIPTARITIDTGITWSVYDLEGWNSWSWITLLDEFRVMQDTLVSSKRRYGPGIELHAGVPGETGEPDDEEEDDDDASIVVTEPEAEWMDDW